MQVCTGLAHCAQLKHVSLTMKTILCAHRVQRRSCPSPKAVIHVSLSFYAVEHNAVGKNTTNGDLDDVRSPFRAAGTSCADHECKVLRIVIFVIGT